MTAATRHRRTDESVPRDRGVSLAELIVTVGIMTLIGTLVMGVAVTVLKTYAGIDARLDNTTQSELGVAASGKVLRTAILPAQLEDTVCAGCSDTAILSATKTAITFYANVGNTTVGPSLVTLKVVADPAHPRTGKLVQDTQPPISSGNGQYRFCDRALPTCVVRSRAIARGLTWPSPGVFTYYDYEGAAITQATLSTATLPRVSSVDVVVTVQTKPGDADFPPRTAVSRIRLPNVEINVLTETGT
ncbi:hypothetical protein [Nocardioides sp. 1609]|uniref:hypothetical protein n=1 Tax=Nocardioides sp. 1609 TaxID=2508327 RepID=UPI00106FB8C1|nr:hypothetical protein [Nocardioides sp. 1609]